MSWKALMSRWTSLGMLPCSLSGAWLAGHRARLRMRPMTALTRGHLRMTAKYLNGIYPFL